MAKIYYLTQENKRRYLALVITTTIGGLILIYLILWFSDVIKQYPIIAPFPLVFSIYQVVYLINYYGKKHIVVSEKSIEYNTPKVMFQAKWQDFEKLSSGWHEQIKQEGIVIDKLKLETKNAFQQLPSKEYVLSKSSKAFIPLSCFSENWRDSELGQQVKQHAPHLFEKEKSA
jgi:hypothetical protein